MSQFTSVQDPTNYEWIASRINPYRSPFKLYNPAGGIAGRGDFLPWSLPN